MSHSVVVDKPCDFSICGSLTLLTAMFLLNCIAATASVPLNCLLRAFLQALCELWECLSVMFIVTVFIKKDGVMDKQHGVKNEALKWHGWGRLLNAYIISYPSYLSFNTWDVMPSFSHKLHGSEKNYFRWLWKQLYVISGKAHRMFELMAFCSLHIRTAVLHW